MFLFILAQLIPCHCRRESQGEGPTMIVHKPALLFLSLIHAAAAQCDPAGLAVPAGVNVACPPGPTVPDTGRCVATQTHFTCTDAVCGGTTWTAPVCTQDDCEKSTLGVLTTDPSITLSGCGGAWVTKGQACGANKPGHTCTDAVCTGPAWVAPVCTQVDCERSTLDAGVLTTDPSIMVAGCGGAWVTKGKTCGASKLGHSCTDAVCTGPAWVDPVCTQVDCERSTLDAGVLTTDPNITVAGCGGAWVTKGQACGANKPGHTCTDAVCTGPAWADPVCTQVDCRVTDLPIPADVVRDISYTCVGEWVADGASCTAARPGFTCSDAQCSGTMWTLPTCVPNMCGGGPQAGTVPANPPGSGMNMTEGAVNLMCNGLQSGDTCVNIYCGEYHARSKNLYMVCDASGRYDASSIVCEPYNCTAGPVPFPDYGYPVEFVGGTASTQFGQPPQKGQARQLTWDWAHCKNLTTGSVCPAGIGYECSYGWQATGDIPLRCTKAGFFNASAASCVPNTCGGGPYAGVPPESSAGQFGFCSGLTSGMVCEPAQPGAVTPPAVNLMEGYECGMGFHGNADFNLVCAPGNGTYDAAGSGCGEYDCMGGPHSTTLPLYTSAANFAACNAMTTGDVCRAGSDWTCNPGYTAVGDVTLDCMNHYNVSGTSCVPNACSGGPTNIPANTDAGKLSVCTAMKSGDTCAGYGCAMGFEPRQGWVLICDGSGNYDAGNASCTEGPCWRGPRPGTLPPFTNTGSFTACNALNTGDTCNAITCAFGYVKTGSLTMACMGGLYDASMGVTCEPAACTGPIASSVPKFTTAAQFAPCNAVKTGEVCSFTCDTGYVPAFSFSPVCDAMSGEYSAAGAQCVTESPCNRGPYAMPENINIAGFEPCNKLASGAQCANYTCHVGFSPGAPLLLNCSHGYYNASDAECVPNSCSGGATNVALQLKVASYAVCDGFVSGETCSAENYTCVAGTHPVGDFNLQCDSANKTYWGYGKCVGDVCTSGPVSNPHNIDFTTCNRLVHGQTCEANFVQCPAGLVARGTFEMQCVNGRYDASGITCVPQTCTTLHCNGRASAAVPSQTQPGVCLCTCNAGWRGPTCNECVPPNPLCLTCTSQDHCNGNAAKAVKVGGSCACTCGGQWTGPTCAVCPSIYHQTGCNDCADGRFGYPACGVCTSVDVCNNRALAVRLLHSEAGSSCVCDGCVGQWSGDRCEICSPQFTGPGCDQCAVGYSGYPNCVACSHRDCNGRSVSVTSNGDQCLCTCTGKWAEHDCSVCPPNYKTTSRDTCDACAVGYHGYPACLACTNSTHCNSRAVSVTTTGSDCTCTCRNQWTGPHCDVCPPRFNASDDCSSCAAGHVHYPLCSLCDITDLCNKRAVAVTTNVNHTACVCTCSGQWTGEACETCPSQYDPLTCNRCGDRNAAYPDCAPCASHVHCNGRAAGNVVPNADRSMCICGVCVDQWTGPKCDVCEAPYDPAVGCNQCLSGYISYPLCERCTIATHCNGQAVAVSSSGDKTECVCTCDPDTSWTGDDCTQCAPQYEQTTCAECEDGYISYPACVLCTAELHCSGRGVPTGSNNGTACVCDCRNAWSGPSCGVCPSAFTGDDCNACADSSLGYPECGGNTTDTPPTEVPATSTPDTPAPATPAPTVAACAAAKVVCTARDQCHEIGACDPVSLTCSNPASVHGKSCDDGDSMTIDDSCVSGVCVGAVPCGAAACTVDAHPECREAVCSVRNGAEKACEVRMLSNTPCNDGLAWTVRDRCTDGICAGEDVPCTVPPVVAHGRVSCPAKGAFGAACTVVPVSDAYTCQGTAHCAREAAPRYTSTIVCAVRTCALPAVMPSGVERVPAHCSAQGNVLSFTGSCRVACRSGYAAVGASPFANLRCASNAGTIDVGSFFSCKSQQACNPATAPAAAQASVQCAGATSEGAGCRVAPHTGYNCTGLVVCRAGTYASTLSCAAVACADDAAPSVAHGVVRCADSVCAVEGQVGYACTGGVRCVGGAYVHDVVCAQTLCARNHFVVSGACVLCEGRETRPAGDDPAAGADTRCAPPGLWELVADVSSTLRVSAASFAAGVNVGGAADTVAPCSAADGDPDFAGVFRLDMGTVSDYLKVPPAATACDVLQGRVPPLYGRTQDGPWERLAARPAGSDAGVLGGYDQRNRSSIGRAYDVRPFVATWGGAQQGACCGLRYGDGSGSGLDGGDERWGLPYRLYALKKGESHDTPAPTTERIFRVLYGVEVAQFKETDFKAAIEAGLRELGRQLVDFVVLMVCPEAACPNGACPRVFADSIAAGCVPGRDAVAAAKGGAGVLQAAASYVDFDMTPGLLPAERTEQPQLSVLKKRAITELQAMLDANASSALTQAGVSSLAEEDRVVGVVATAAPPVRVSVADDDDDGLPWWVWLLIALGALCLLCCSLLLACLWFRRRRHEEEEEEAKRGHEGKEMNPEATGSAGSDSPQSFYPDSPRQEAQYLYPRGDDAPMSAPEGEANNFDGLSTYTPESAGPSASQVHVNPISQTFVRDPAVTQPPVY